MFEGLCYCESINKSKKYRKKTITNEKNKKNDVSSSTPVLAHLALPLTLGFASRYKQDIVAPRYGFNLRKIKILAVGC